MSHAKNKMDWCLDKAKKEGKNHRGLVKINPDLENKTCAWELNFICKQKWI